MWNAPYPGDGTQRYCIMGDRYRAVMNKELETNVESAVRKFLEFVADPVSARDEQLISGLRDQLGAAKDPIAKLKLLAALDRAEKADGEALRRAFVLNARSWATENAIPVRAFRELGVNDIVLAEAGFDLGTGRPVRRAGSATPAQSKPRAKSVGSDEVRHWVLEQAQPFTLTQVMSGAGGSLGTITKVVDDLVATSQLAKLGPVPNHSGRGRAPHQFGRP